MDASANRSRAEGDRVGIKCTVRVDEGNNHGFAAKNELLGKIQKIQQHYAYLSQGINRLQFCFEIMGFVFCLQTQSTIPLQPFTLLKL